MKILVFSDSHNCQEHMLRAVETERPDQIFHLGDHAQDGRTLPVSVPVTVVRGNCDWGDPARDTELVTVQGVRFLLTHGHLYGVKQTPYRAILAAQEAKADVLLYGHTHRATCFQEDACWILNPGSCMGSTPITYGVIELVKNTIVCRIETLKP